MRSLVVLAVLAVAATRGTGADLVFPDGKGGAHLRVAVTDEGRSPDVAWAAFLDKLFAHFDRDGSGGLSEAEAKRVIPLPLPVGTAGPVGRPDNPADGKAVGPDFAAMDADRDGKVTPAEFRAFYRARGFVPVAAVVRPATAEALALGDALFRHLDRDRDGALSAAELQNADGLLGRFDEDEDEVLTAKELLGADAERPVASPAGVKTAAEPDAPGATLRLALGGKSALAGDDTRFRLSPDGVQLRVPGGACSVAVSQDDPAAGFRAAKGFYLAQFKGLAGTKPAAKALFADDPTAQVLEGLFDAADRDGDGRLTLAELEAFFDLVERGVGCRVVVAVSDRGRNLFDLIDANGDGRLDGGELRHAARTLPRELARDKPLTRGAVPAAYRLAAGRGPAGDAFGPVPFGAAARPAPPAAKAARGPAWFRAQDRNGDGFVSAREFVGPPELFAKLDADGDGRISVEEAEAAKP
jgi:hypothetical protein